MAYTIFIDYKGVQKAVINAAYSPDGSIYITDLLSKYVEQPLYEIVTYDLPMNHMERQIEIKADEIRYTASSQLKLSHHTSGFFQVSGPKIISGIDPATGKPRGLSVPSFNLNKTTNDGGPFVAGLFYGLNNLPDYKSKESIPIVFTNNEVDYQSMNICGKRLAFVLLFFHFPIDRLLPEYRNSEWGYYNYEKLKKPALIRILKQNDTSEYVVGISCLKARCDFKSSFGFTLGGGSGEINTVNQTCKNLSVFFPKQEGGVNDVFISLDREIEVQG